MPRIDELDFEFLPTLTHELAAMHAGRSVRLSVQQIATLTIAEISDSPPGTLDTLNELAAALGDDPNFATTVTNSIALRMLKSANLSDVAVPATALANLGGLATSALPAALAVAIAGYAAKATPAVGDLFGFVQTSDNTGRKLTFAQLVAALFTNANAMLGQQVGYAEALYSSNTNITTVLPADATIPQITEGDLIHSITYTPKSVTNKLVLQMTGMVTPDSTNYVCAAFFQDAGPGAMQAEARYCAAAGATTNFNLRHTYVPGVITPITITSRAGPGAAGMIRLNGTHAGNFFGTSVRSLLTIKEIKA